jgi:5,5'-dehydrodivanillate O-demethylase oxygenase subunit
MGDLLRCYWWPIAGASEVKCGGTLAIRLLGEDLVVFRDEKNALGLVDRFCPHRGADLSLGYVEMCAIRCSYHGWLFGADGTCLERPFDDLHDSGAGRKRISLIHYPIQEYGGLLWAYLGQHPAPLLPNWEFFSWQNGFVQVVISDLPCNWFQCQENSIDPVHFEWQHGNWPMRTTPSPRSYQPRHVKIDFEEFEYGFIYRRLREGGSENHPLWRTGRVCLWPAALFTGNHIEYRVPIDDHRTRSITWSFSRVPNEEEPFVQEAIPTWHGPVFDSFGKVITSHLTNQDFAAWLAQGVIADRSREHLGFSDRGIAMLRQRFWTEIEAVSKGEDPKGVIRNHDANDRIELPVAERQFLINGATRAEMIDDPDKRARLRGYILQAGQPAEVRLAFEKSMGIAGLVLPEQNEPVDILSSKLM